MNHKTRRRAARRRAIPWPVAVGLLFIPEGLPEQEYRLEVRKLTRRALVPFRGLERGPFLVQDEQMGSLVRRVAEEA